MTRTPPNGLTAGYTSTTPHVALLPFYPSRVQICRPRTSNREDKSKGRWNKPALQAGGADTPISVAVFTLAAIDSGILLLRFNGIPEPVGSRDSIAIMALPKRHVRTESPDNQESGFQEREKKKSDIFWKQAFSVQKRLLETVRHSYVTTKNWYKYTENNFQTSQNPGWRERGLPKCEAITSYSTWAKRCDQTGDWRLNLRSRASLWNHVFYWFFFN